MVAVKVTAEKMKIHDRPFSIGKVTKVNGDELNIHWYGTYSNKKPLTVGRWFKAEIVAKDGRVEYVTNNHHTGRPYDNIETGNRVFIRDVIGQPFMLNDDRTLPKHIATELKTFGPQKKKHAKKKTC